MITEQLIDYLRMTVVCGGGITPLKKIAVFADMYHIQTGCHGATDLSPVTMGAALHFDISVNNFEELSGLAESGGDGLECVKQIYQQAYDRRSELSTPYATVIDIDPEKLPLPAAVFTWSLAQFAGALRHDTSSPFYNKSFRQLLHIAFKVAARVGGAYLDLLVANEILIAKNATFNLFERHIRPVFIGT